MIDPVPTPRRAAALIALVATAAAALGLASAVATAGADPPAPLFPATPAGGPALSILEAGPTADAQAIGAALAATSLGVDVGVDQEGARVALRRPEGSVYVVPTRRGWTCVVLVHQLLDRVPAASCAPTRELADDALTVEVSDGVRAALAGVVPDGYTMARIGAAATPVQGNAFLGEVARGATTLSVSGPGRPPLERPSL